MAEAVKKEKKSFFKFVKWFWILFGSGILFATLVFLLASWGFLGYMPEFEHLENPETNLASQVISSDGELLGKYYLDDNRTPVSYEQLPKNLVDALIATEDVRYYNHAGIDWYGTLRAVIAKLTFRNKGGASTISQQLARQLFVGKRAKDWKKYTQKIREWVIATRLERQYTKEEIIAMYFNIYDWGYSADGIRSASNIYFGKEPQNLKIEESAMLVGMFKNSSYFNPIRRKELVKNRRNTVIGQMTRNGYLSQKEGDSLEALDMKLNFNLQNHREGLATYFRMYLQRFVNDWAKKNPRPALEGERDVWSLTQDGLKIYTTIDSRMQKNAEDAVEMHMAKLQAEFNNQNTPDRNKTAPFLDLEPDEINRIIERAIKTSDRWREMKKQGKSEKEIRASFKKPTEMKIFDWRGLNKERDTVMTPLDSIRYYKSILRTAMMSMEPQTGHVKAWVGGINYKHFQYDNVIQGARQVGSTFKPFVYATAIDQLRMSPCDSLPDIKHCIPANKYGPDAWCPNNSDGENSGENMTLKHALANSVNSITAKLIDDVGPANVVKLVKKMGLTKEIPEVPSIALGTVDFNVYDMVGAYGAFVNQGVYVKPVMITRIEDKNGTVLYEYVPETKDVMSKDVAYAMVNLMEGVTRSGSGARLRHTYNKNNYVYKEIITGYPYEFANPIAGKTGTTQNQSDGWFMGMVPNLVTGVWVGGEERATHFNRIDYGQGASMALPIWALYMKENYANKELGISDKEFPKPANMSINVDCAKVQREMRENALPEENLDDIDF